MKSDDDCVSAYMPLFYGDYLKDTGDLDCLEHGAYLQLLAELWTAGGYLPFEPQRLAKRINLRFGLWDGVWAAISRFFDVLPLNEGEPPRLSQKRLLYEMQKARELRQRRSDSGRKAGLASSAARATVVEKSLNDTPNDSPTIFNHSPKPKPSESSSNSESSLSLQIQGNPDQTRAHVERLPLLTEPALLTFPCDGTVETFDVTAALLKTHQDAFPALDVLAEYQHALVWIQANPGQRKTSKGMPRFLVNWLGNAQNSGRGRAVAALVRQPARNFTEEANNLTRQAYLAMIAPKEPT